MKRPIAVLPLALLLAAAPAGCGGDGGEEQGNTQGVSTTETTTGPGKTTAGGGRTVRVSMKDIRYVPANVTVRVGDKVRWTNDDPVAHTVTATSGARFDSGNIDAGGHYTYTPTGTGRISYYCTIHGRQQSGTITVR